MSSAIPFTQPGTSPTEVTLYRITSETVFTGTGCPPPSIGIYNVRTEGEPRWFGPLSLPRYDRKELTVYQVARPVPAIKDEERLGPCSLGRKTEEHYFAIEPELERILMIPLKSELVKALQRSPLWRRILVAFFPERYWPRHY